MSSPTIESLPTLSDEARQALQLEIQRASLDEAKLAKIRAALDNVNRPGIRLDVRAIPRLMKPVTWFPPMWAFLCGAVSTGADLLANWHIVVAGLILAGPLMCAMSQTMNDYFDREVDAINEPDRPIPAGLISKSASWIVTFTLIGLAFIISYWIHPFVLAISFASVLMSHIYSGPPLRAKNNGWFGNLVVGLAYEGVAWLTGSFSLTKGMPSAESIGLAIVFSLGAHGIMTLNDFKSVIGDRIRGVRSIPVQLGERRAAMLACAVMNAAQVIALGILIIKAQFVAATFAFVLLLIQQPMQQILIRHPKERAIWYNSFGTLLYVLSMMVSAIGVRP
ncbi:MAG: chlorophyll synthase ChlG [Chloroherpetonaceae bacterium]|nr:chlorophyll synthase ChlG [Chloroherpetonaceae bacterium]MCS7212558.1 chlorophyll synthase ChlG [Chloroherpetonaceae bacterium]MDW8018701.1 chlorophyll synthase ChlG [Chloroherpetonaceae bacterium]